MASQFNVLRQKRHDLKAEGLKLLDIAAADRTADQVARLDALEGEVAALDKDIDRLAQFMETERAQGTGVAANRLEIGDDHATEKPWAPAPRANATDDEIRQHRHATLGMFGIAVKDAMSGKPADVRLFAGATGMGTAVPSDGGFAVPVEVAPGIERLMFQSGDILSRVDARTISGNAMSFNVLDETSRVDGSRQGGVLGYWVDEGTAPTASQFKLARMELKLRKVGALGYVTDELMADAAALGGELENMFTGELVFQVEQAIWAGAGGVKPLGWTVAPCMVSVAKVSGQAAASIKTRNLSDMWARLPARSQKNAVWLGNVDIQPELDELVNPAGTAGISPRFVNYDATGAMTIKGRPIVFVEYASTLGTQFDLAVCDLSQYRLIRKGGVEAASSIHVRFTQGEQTFRAFYRCDGQPVPRAAITPYKGSKTLSPFIALDTRS